MHFYCFVQLNCYVVLRCSIDQNQSMLFNFSDYMYCRVHLYVFILILSLLKERFKGEDIAYLACRCYAAITSSFGLIVRCFVVKLSIFDYGDLFVMLICSEF